MYYNRNQLRHDFHRSMGIIGNVPDSALCDLIFNAFDRDHTGCLSFEQYIYSLGIMTKGTDEEKLVNIIVR